MPRGLKEAYAALGYLLAAPRTDWSALNDQGVCLSFWSSKMTFESGLSSYDTREQKHKARDWHSDAGNKRRLMHLRSAMERDEGWIDVVLLEGVAEERKVKSAQHWISERRGYSWRVVWFDEVTGDFRAELFDRTRLNT
jgi:heme-degrading monooxygenase HmoA